MERTYRPYEVNQRLLLPPDLREWVPEGHLALFILNILATSSRLARIPISLPAQACPARPRPSSPA